MKIFQRLSSWFKSGSSKKEVVSDNDKFNEFFGTYMIALTALFNAPDLAEARKIIETGPKELLLEDTDEVLAYFLEQHHDNPDFVRTIDFYRNLLARCRQEGVEAAFASLPGGDRR